MSIQMGRYNRLVVTREAPPGVYLAANGIDDAYESDSDEEFREEVLLPNRYVPDDTMVGDELDVFVYTDSEDRPVATTQTPKAIVGDFAFLRVIDVSDHGAFLDWGLDKDLFAPFSEQRGRLKIGDERVFAISLDPKSGRVMASSQLRDHLDMNVDGIRPHDEVDLLVYHHNDIGTLVVVDGAHSGLIYRDQTFQALSVGEELSGYVDEVRSDGKLDIRLQRTGKPAINDAQQVLLGVLQHRGGFLPLHDKSSPNAIRRELSMSKNAFKRALGGLYKARLVTLHQDGIRLSETNGS